MSVTRYCKNLHCANIIPVNGIDTCIICFCQSINDLFSTVFPLVKPVPSERDRLTRIIGLQYELQHEYMLFAVHNL